MLKVCPGWTGLVQFEIDWFRFGQIGIGWMWFSKDFPSLALFCEVWPSFSKFVKVGLGLAALVQGFFRERSRQYLIHDLTKILAKNHCIIFPRFF